MGEIVQNDLGGYAVREIKGFETRVYKGYTSMMPRENDPQSGPSVELYGELFTEPVDLDRAMGAFRIIRPDVDITESRTVQVDGVDGMIIEFIYDYHALDGVIPEFSGADEGENIRGLAVVAVVDGFRLFRCVMIAPDKEWKTYAPVFQGVVESVKFLR